MVTVISGAPRWLPFLGQVSPFYVEPLATTPTTQRTSGWPR